MIYNEIIKLANNKSTKEEMKDAINSIITFDKNKSRLLNEDVPALFSQLNNMVYSYTIISKHSLGKDAYSVIVNSLAYDEKANGLYAFESYDCDVINYPDDLTNIVDYLEAAGYTEVAPSELFKMQFQGGIKRINKDWVESILGDGEENNINNRAKIPNETNCYLTALKHDEIDIEKI